MTRNTASLVNCILIAVLVLTLVTGVHAHGPGDDHGTANADQLIDFEALGATGTGILVLGTLIFLTSLFFIAYSVREIWRSFFT